ncbi:hypothetical protein [Neobacillus sp. DY30]|uniref:hypothetical protein n=1 Tax=Neobacillus sp. DY30 TaxID=3047871 RepID=UPI0024C01383|nr:hypothetical protein [Neobacillus sp. DY30]WHX99979.1 hypothetical protein QNH29_26030 [Neobacillus sp. DY30]
MSSTRGIEDKPDALLKRFVLNLGDLTAPIVEIAADCDSLKINGCRDYHDSLERDSNLLSLFHL